MIRHEADLAAALKADLGKSRMESYMCEIGLTLSELTWMQKHLRSLMRSKRVSTPVAQFAAKSFRSPSPYGTVLIMSPWNYPVLLTLDPLIDAIAAGNTAVVKPSAYAPCTFDVMKTMIEECFPAHYVAVVDGGRAENQALLQQRFDMIFFTGGKTVGREVLRSAAEYLTPVTLELGGKSPCIVDATAKLPLAARRIVFGKYLNCGQTCVAPDYVYCAASVKDALVDEMKKQIWKQFGDDPLANADYGRIVNEKHFRRLLGLIDPTKVVAGGVCDSSLLQIAPTIMDYFGLPIPKLLEGKSMLPQIYEPSREINDVVYTEFTRYELDHDGFGGLQIMRAVMSKRYKLVIHLLDSDEFYDLEKDPYEMNNLIDDETYTEIRNEMHDRLIEHMNSTRDLYRGYQWRMRPWRKDFIPNWENEGYTRQRENEEYEPRQLDYDTGLPMESSVRKKC